MQMKYKKYDVKTQNVLLRKDVFLLKNALRKVRQELKQFDRSFTESAESIIEYALSITVEECEETK